MDVYHEKMERTRSAKLRIVTKDLFLSPQGSGMVEAIRSQRAYFAEFYLCLIVRDRCLN